MCQKRISSPKKRSKKSLSQRKMKVSNLRRQKSLCRIPLKKVSVLLAKPRDTLKRDGASENNQPEVAPIIEKETQILSALDHELLKLKARDPARYRASGFKCPLCDKKFRGGKQWKNHIRAKHTRETPFHCSKCDKNYCSYSSLASHLLTHGEKTHKCDSCPEAFFQKGQLKVHKELHHSGPLLNVALNLGPRSRWTCMRWGNIKAFDHTCATCVDTVLQLKVTWKDTITQSTTKIRGRQLKKISPY